MCIKALSMSPKLSRVVGFQNSDSCEGFNTFYNDIGVVILMKQVTMHHTKC